MVFYRKYRPQTIDELDSESLRKTLDAVLSASSIPHAFLFTGPKGLGKTSTARILAKIINCEKRIGNNPCNQCSQCISITKGSNVDVMEIDGASNRGIDEIRDLREKVHLAPASAPKKIYIIDEVHMLTTEAFNALLKTIEEPPNHVVFIFCTTEPHRVPATIISRCFHISFFPATDQELVRSFKRIAMGEKIDITDDALLAIAKLSDGGFRDGTKILEELSLFSSNKITVEFVEEHYKVSGIKLYLEKFVEFLSGKNIKEATILIEELVKKGIDLKYFVNQSLLMFHNLLLQKIEINRNSQFTIHNSKLTIEEIKNLTELLMDVYQQMKYAVVLELPLELMVISWCQKDNISMPLKKDNDDKKVSVDSLLKKQQELKIKAVLSGKKEDAIESSQDDKKIVETKHEQTILDGSKDQKTSLLENIIYKVKPINNSVAGVLRGCQISKFNNEELIFQTAYKFHSDRLTESKTLDILEKIVKQITGKSVRISVELKQGR